MREALVTLSDDELEAIGFHGLVETVREAGIRDVEMLEDAGDRCLPQAELAEPIDVDAVTNYDCVERCEFVTEREETYVYIMELTAPLLPDGMSADFEDIVGTSDPTVTDYGVILSFVGSQEAIRNVLRNYQEAGVMPDLLQLGEYDGGEETLDSLTDRQREVLETAYDLGFYEIPREASTEDLAGELGIDPATASEHLQRAERNLLTSQLAT